MRDRRLRSKVFLAVYREEYISRSLWLVQQSGAGLSKSLNSPSTTLYRPKQRMLFWMPNEEVRFHLISPQQAVDVNLRR